MTGIVPRSERGNSAAQAPWERTRAVPIVTAPPTRGEAVQVPEKAAAAERPPEQTNSRLLAATGSIALATLISRITGFLKQALLLIVLGELVASSYTVAAQVPNMIAEFVLGAVLTAIVVPVLVRAEKEDADRGAAFVRRLFTAALIMLGVAAVLAVSAAPLLARLFLAGDSKVDKGLTTALLYLLLPAILLYGLSALFTAILNTRLNFKPGAWAPVFNNLVVLTVLGVYLLVPGNLVDNPSLSNPKLLVLGLGVTLGVVVQVVTLIPALRRNKIDLRPLWGLDDRLRQFGGMAVAIVLYVLISQVGLLFATNISSGADEAGPAIYNNAWLLLQLPYGVLGVTVLTAIMPRLSRNAASGDTPAVVDDLSVATRMTMLALIPVIGFLTFAGKQVGEALYGYGNFAGDAGRLGEAVSWSAFTLIPYSLVLIHLRVFYAREQAWTPTWIVLGITGVKVAFSALAPVVASSDQQVVLFLGVANGLGYITGAIIGWMLLRRSLEDLTLAGVRRTVVVVTSATLAAGALMVLLDRLLRLQNLTDAFGGIGSLFRVAFDGAFMLLLVIAVLYRARIPEIIAVATALRRRLGRERPIDDMPPAPREVVSDPMFAATEVIPAIRIGPTPPRTSRSAPVTGRGALPYPGDRHTPPTGFDRRFAPSAEWETAVIPRYSDAPPEHASSTGEGVALTDDDASRGRKASDASDARVSGGVSTDTDARPVGAALTKDADEHETDDATAVSTDSAVDETAADDIVVESPQAAADSVAATSGHSKVDETHASDTYFETSVPDDEDEDSSDLAAAVADDATDDEPLDDTHEASDTDDIAVGEAQSSTDTGSIATGAPLLPPIGGSDVGAPDAAKAATRGPKLIPGASVAGGRYRLLAPHGGVRGLEFWQAHDVKLDREVALTFVDAEQHNGSETSSNGPQAVLSRTLRLGRINSPGLARVLDVVRGSSGGIVVAEWTRGRSLREMADTVPSPVGAANAIKSLAAAAEAAHRGGGALSIDHPDRVRISTKGDAVLAFPATLGDADPGADVRGLGAMLYALITARWPLADNTPDSSQPRTVGGMAVADRTSAGTPVEPRAIRSDVPFEISAVAVRALEQNSGIRTAATVQHILGQAAVVNETTEMIPALRLGQRPPGATGHGLPDPENFAADNKKSNMMLGVMVGLGIFVVAILGLAGWLLANFFAGGGTDSPLTEQNFGLTTTAEAPAAPADGQAPAAAAPAATAATISSVSVFSPGGTADNPSTANNVLDNNASTVWDTDSYFQPFPSLKSGVGLMTTLGTPANISAVTIDTTTPGTIVEIRSASSDNPALDQTQVIGRATLTNGLNTIAVTSDGPVGNVLFWLTDLGTPDGQNRSTIADIGVVAP